MSPIRAAKASSAISRSMKKDKAIRAVVHKPVQAAARVIEQHAEKKLQKRNGNNGGVCNEQT